MSPDSTQSTQSTQSTPSTPADPADQRVYLSVLAAAPPATVKQLAETLLANLPDVTVIYNRTGLVMLPYTESVEGQEFHLGETLVSEARVRVHGQEGYAACLGRDLEQSLAIAIVDAVLQGGQTAPDNPAFSPARRAAILQVVTAESQAQAQADRELLQKVEATRIELETF